MKTILSILLCLAIAGPAFAEMYRYRQVTDEFTTYYAEPPIDEDGNRDQTWYEHCMLADGYVYITTSATVPQQIPSIDWQQISQPDPVYEQVMDASVHSELMGERIEQGLYMRDDKHVVPGTDAQVSAWAKAGVLEWGDPALWTINPVMTGDQRTFAEKLWVSLMDYNIWEPPIGWREVVETGYPAWVQPTGAHDAYNIGERVTFNGTDYESVIDANVWSPAAYPAGWVQI